LFGRVLQGSGIPFKFCHPLSELPDPRLELRFVNDAFGIAVDQAADATPKLAKLALNHLEFDRLRAHPYRIQAALVS
jgi:hypothetical protein